MRRSFMQSASILGEIEAQVDAQRGLRPLGRQWRERGGLAYRTERRADRSTGCRDDFSMDSLPTWPSRLISNTTTGWRPCSARPSQRSVIFRWTAARYHANGKSVTLSVMAPAPCAEPDGWPSAGGGGSGARGRRWAPARDAGVVLLLAIGGSSFSPARGVAAARGGSARSGRLRSGRLALRSGRLGARAGRSGGGAGAALRGLALGELAGGALRHPRRRLLRSRRQRGRRLALRRADGGDRGDQVHDVRLGLARRPRAGRHDQRDGERAVASAPTARWP